MAESQVTHTLVKQTELMPSFVNQNFRDVQQFVNTETVHRDGTGFVDALVATGAKPFNVAWGRIAIATTTSDVLVDEVGPSTVLLGTLSPSLVANRRYRISFRGAAAGTNMGGQPRIAATTQLVFVGFGQLQNAQISIRNVGDQHLVSLDYYHSQVLNAAPVWELRGATSAGSWTMTAGVFRPNSFVIEDIGPQ